MKHSENPSGYICEDGLPLDAYTSNHESSILLAREIDKLLRRERLKAIIPEVVKDLFAFRSFSS